MKNSITRIYVDTKLSVGHDVELPKAAHHRVIRVLRLSAGAPITLFNGCGGEFSGVISSHNLRSTFVTVDHFSPIERESPLSVTLVQGISRGERMDYTIQKAVELGVEAIVPFQAVRTGVRLPVERRQRRLEHWRGIIRHACEQCGRNRVPALSEIQSLDEVLPIVATKFSLLLHPAGKKEIPELSNNTQPLLLIVGPEGGLDDTETARLEAANCFNLCVGPRILRTETAAVAALSILQARFGDFAF